VAGKKEVKKILSIVWYKVLPPVFGGQKGIAHFNKHLAWHIPLVCLCSRDNEPAGQIPYKVIAELPTGKGQFINPLCWQKISTVARKEEVTHILLEHPYHGIAAIKAKKATGARLIVHAHNIESQRFRLAGKWGWQLLRKYERWVHRKADLSLFKTEEDKRYAIEHFGLREDQCKIVPYGIEKPDPIDKELACRFIRNKYDIGTNEKIFLFAGTLDYMPNAKAVEDIFKEIAPRLTAANIPFKIIICGRNRFPSFHYLNQLTHPAVIMAGEVEDIALHFTAADAFINPVQYGGGVQTKNMDALAHHCNVVCFSNMSTTEIASVAGDKLFTCPPGDWGAFIVQLQVAAGSQTDTPVLFFETYNWKRIVLDLTTIV
jgi:glycosyltransferase involved in cell wall biosynthesis